MCANCFAPYCIHWRWSMGSSNEHFPRSWSVRVAFTNPFVFSCFFHQSGKALSDMSAEIFESLRWLRYTSKAFTKISSPSFFRFFSFLVPLSIVIFPLMLFFSSFVLPLLFLVFFFIRDVEFILDASLEKFASKTGRNTNTRGIF